MNIKKKLPALDPDHKKLFVDMDGTLALFKPVEQMEELYEKGYFANLSPHMNVINSIRNIIEEGKIEVYILSAVLYDSPYAKKEKIEWLDRFLPEISDERRIFTPVGVDKIQAIEESYSLKVSKNDFLLDDYSKNLKAWETKGSGIKLKNKINGSKGTWKGSIVRYDEFPQRITDSIYRIMGVSRKKEIVLDGSELML